jgi:hypothetical protein
MSDRFYVFGDEVFWFDRVAFARAWVMDRRIPQRIGISRQAAHCYCRGVLSPKADRAVLLRELVPQSLRLVGAMPKGDEVSQ